MYWNHNYVQVNYSNYAVMWCNNITWTWFLHNWITFQRRSLHFLTTEKCGGNYSLLLIWYIEFLFQISYKIHWLNLYGIKNEKKNYFYGFIGIKRERILIWRCTLVQFFSVFIYLTIPVIVPSRISRIPLHIDALYYDVVLIEFSFRVFFFICVH